ncbi:hypothetical protein E1B28_005944 [Marasmius oreades]|uniref:Uncharacterized protein n=1 Tax=Marasmius oreades TaxID=181124 RepID=A0A9P7UVC6_9AGAR|nr:uncharacterized protein E1B28_005944 [Marasmius oreades]KAG7095165.1 hypothetical protein E1B28_005944 [Marasmius oreades]
MLGWSEDTTRKPGSVVRESKPKNTNTQEPSRLGFSLEHTAAKNAINFNSFNGSILWKKCKSSVAQSGDECCKRSWVFYQSPLDESITIGRVAEILTDETMHIIVIEEFQIAPNRDAFFELPYVYRRQGEESCIIVLSQNILFRQNVQHDCRKSKCEGTGVRARQQERQESNRIIQFIEHKSDDHFLINLYAFHNAHLVRRILPRGLTAPSLFFPDRINQHDKVAEGLRVKLTRRKDEIQRRCTEKRKQQANDGIGGAKRSRAN